jgi:hypothetical protein
MSIRNELLERILARLTQIAGVVPDDNAVFGYADYNDTATAIAPIAVPTGLVETPLTNNGLGARTSEAYLPDGVSSLWNAGTGFFDLSSLGLGATVDIRLDVTVTTTTPNQSVNIGMNLDIGGSPYNIPFITREYKSAESHSISVMNGIYIGNSGTMLNPAQLVIKSDAAATVVVNGWYVRVIKRA